MSAPSVITAQSKYKAHLAALKKAQDMVQNLVNADFTEDKCRPAVDHIDFVTPSKVDHKSKSKTTHEEADSDPEVVGHSKSTDTDKSGEAVQLKQSMLSFKKKQNQDCPYEGPNCPNGQAGANE
ncbi:hypothetical protein GYMLUDRAFT_250912 [Collybiopsis luxurians FD-317 M1]|uniref:Uncharacterized protein n=1 Tax=Collybiopsis luxurians FD-317 M1 TaxID=944289 RepID=A0A0D0C4L7_9AGAR|nr:hypothetical protein GYMLUDRAFT_250912 [Collybiopsis luxurians FD-317 M1]